MPILNPNTGEVAYSHQLILVDDATIRATQNGWLYSSRASWLDDETTIYQSFNFTTNQCFIEAYNRTTKTRSELAPRGANFIASGGGRWIAWLGGYGIFGSIRDEFAGPKSVGPDGTIALTPAYQDGLGVTLYAPDGRMTSGPNVPIYDFQVLGPTSGIYTSGQVIHGLNARVPPVLDGIPVWGPKRVEVNGEEWITYWGNQGLVVHPYDDYAGYILETTGHAFHHDAIAWNGKIRVAYSRGEGELLSEIVVVDIDLASPRIALGTTQSTDYGPPIERGIWYGWYKNLNTAIDGSQGSCYHAERVGLVRLSDGALIARPDDGEGLRWVTPNGDIWMGAQAYLAAPGPATVVETRTLLRLTIDALVAEWNGRPGVLVPQAYDRGGAWLNQETLVGMQIEYLDAARRHTNIVALVPFALDRDGGANAYPALRAAWDAIGQRLHPPDLPAVASIGSFPTAITVEYPPGGITVRGTGPNKIITIDHVGGLPPGVKSVVRMNDLNMTAEYQERTTGRVLAKTGAKRPVRLEP